jgi:hypothetical protein
MFVLVLGLTLCNAGQALEMNPDKAQVNEWSFVTRVYSAYAFGPQKSTEITALAKEGVVGPFCKNLAKSAVVKGFLAHQAELAKLPEQALQAEEIHARTLLSEDDFVSLCKTYSKKVRGIAAEMPAIEDGNPGNASEQLQCLHVSLIKDKAGEKSNFQHQIDVQVKQIVHGRNSPYALEVETQNQINKQICDKIKLKMDAYDREKTDYHGTPFRGAMGNFIKAWLQETVHQTSPRVDLYLRGNFTFFCLDVNNFIWSYVKPPLESTFGFFAKMRAAQLQTIIKDHSKKEKMLYEFIDKATSDRIKVVYTFTVMSMQDLLEKDKLERAHMTLLKLRALDGTTSADTTLQKKNKHFVDRLKIDISSLDLNTRIPKENPTVMNLRQNYQKDWRRLSQIDIRLAEPSNPWHRQYIYEYLSIENDFSEFLEKYKLLYQEIVTPEGLKTARLEPWRKEADVGRVNVQYPKLELHQATPATVGRPMFIQSFFDRLNQWKKVLGFSDTPQVAEAPCKLLAQKLTCEKVIKPIFELVVADNLRAILNLKSFQHDNLKKVLFNSVQPGPVLRQPIRPAGP